MKSRGLWNAFVNVVVVMMMWVGVSVPSLKVLKRVARFAMNKNEIDCSYSGCA